MRSELEVYRIRWEERFKELVEFKKIRGHCNVPMLWPENLKLSNWVYTQRQYRKKGKLNKGRIRRLNEIGFEWHDEYQKAWDSMFSELVEFKKHHGHCEIPSGWAENPKLATWVSNQRRRRYQNAATGKERIRRLKEIGFRWRFTSTWEERFSELAGFKQAHGHINVTPGNCPENLTLRNWVKKQRTKRKEGQLSKDQMKRLDKLGFVWDRSGPTWEEMYSQLIQYKKAHGDCDVPNVWPENPPLGNWVLYQRYLRKKNKLKEDRATKLDGIGFQWQIKKKDNKGA